MNNFLKEYKVDRVDTFKFIILSIFTYGMYSTYWLGKLNRNFNQNFKTNLISEGLIITLGIFSFIELFFLTMAVSSGLDGDLQGLKDLNWMSEVGLWGYLITGVVIAFHIKNQMSMIYIKNKIKFDNNPVYNFNIFFTMLFGVMYVCYKLNQIQSYSKS